MTFVITLCTNIEESQVFDKTRLGTQSWPYACTTIICVDNGKDGDS